MSAVQCNTRVLDWEAPNSTICLLCITCINRIQRYALRSSHVMSCDAWEGSVGAFSLLSAHLQQHPRTQLPTQIIPLLSPRARVIRAPPCTRHQRPISWPNGPEGHRSCARLSPRRQHACWARYAHRYRNRIDSSDHMRRGGWKRQGAITYPRGCGCYRRELGRIFCNETCSRVVCLHTS